MSAQVRTIIGRTPAHVPIRPIVALVGAATAAAIAFGLIAMEQPARVEAPVAELDWAATTGHPAMHDRFGGGEAELSVVPAQRLYPDGFGSRAELSVVPAQRLYPDGFGEPEAEI